MEWLWITVQTKVKDRATNDPVFVLFSHHLFIMSADLWVTGQPACKIHRIMGGCPAHEILEGCFRGQWPLWESEVVTHFVCKWSSSTEMLSHCEHYSLPFPEHSGSLTDWGLPKAYSGFCFTWMKRDKDPLALEIKCSFTGLLPFLGIGKDNN